MGTFLHLNAKAEPLYYSAILEHCIQHSNLMKWNGVVGVERKPTSLEQSTKIWEKCDIVNKAVLWVHSEPNCYSKTGSVFHKFVFKAYSKTKVSRN